MTSDLQNALIDLKINSLRINLSPTKVEFANFLSQTISEKSRQQSYTLQTDSCTDRHTKTEPTNL